MRIFSDPIIPADHPAVIYAAGYEAGSLPPAARAAVRNPHSGDAAVFWQRGFEAADRDRAIGRELKRTWDNLACSVAA